MGAGWLIRSILIGAGSVVVLVILFRLLVVLLLMAWMAAAISEALFRKFVASCRHLAAAARRASRAARHLSAPPN